MIPLILLILALGFLLHKGIPRLLGNIEKKNSYWNSFPESIKGTGEIFIFLNLLLWQARFYSPKIVHNIGSSTFFIWMAGVIGFLAVFFQDISLEKISSFTNFKLRLMRLHRFLHSKVLRILYIVFLCVSRICRVLSYFLIAIILFTLSYIVFLNLKKSNITNIDTFIDLLMYEALFGFMLVFAMGVCWFYRRVILLSLSMERVFFIIISSLFMMPLTFNLIPSLFMKSLTFNLIQIYFSIGRIIWIIITTPLTFLLIFFSANIGINFIFRSSKFAGDILQRTSAILTVIAFCLLIWSGI